MFNKNENKTISVSATGIIVSFTDSNKHHFVKFENKPKPLAKLKKNYTENECIIFNKKQQKMFLEALYGLTIYPESLVDKMPTTIVTKIISRCQIVQKVINRWKQEIINEKVDGLLLSLFPKSPIVKQMVNVKGYDDSIRSKQSFKDLELNQYKIARKLVEENLLPKNFFNLT